MNQESANITQDAYLVLKVLTDASNEPLDMLNGDTLQRTGLSESSYWLALQFLFGNGYAEGSFGDLNKPIWATSKGLNYLETLNEKKRRNAASIPVALRGLVHKIAVLGKQFYTKGMIDDLFIFAGADKSWWQQPVQTNWGERMTQAYGWIDGVVEYAPTAAEKIIRGVALQMAENEEIPEQDKAFLQQFVRTPGQSARDAKPDARIVTMPGDVERLLEVVIKNLPRAIIPLEHRRQGLASLSFDNEYDIQDLLHAMLRPWVRDIRAEEYTPSYVGSSTRIDFLLAAHDVLIEVKYVRDKRHAKKIGDELIIDVAHYSEHPRAKQLWIAVYDPGRLITNPDGLIAQLDGDHGKQDKQISVRTFVL